MSAHLRWNHLLEWSVIPEADLKKIDKDTSAEVEKAVEEANKSPQPLQDKDILTDIYYKGTNPM
ncbi:hypothetical protein B0A53_04541 [Rhodotorula sp. CCFEE 5036]|nr:hypothetical protein B0A53_04541 [Rhodotorula sp. CCFEE 5036]